MHFSHFLPTSLSSSLPHSIHSFHSFPLSLSLSTSLILTQLLSSLSHLSFLCLSSIFTLPFLYLLSLICLYSIFTLPLLYLFQFQPQKFSFPVDTLSPLMCFHLQFLLGNYLPKNGTILLRDLIPMTELLKWVLFESFLFFADFCWSIINIYPNPGSRGF